MDDNIGYFDKLWSDLPQQFRGKPNIEAFLLALAKQLTGLRGFFAQLETLRSLQAAEGAQLDGIGGIVAMSRTEALAVSKMANQVVPMDDKTYRMYLTWKNNINTTGCTHSEVYRALKMFWARPLYYREDPACPATMFYDAPILDAEDSPISVNIMAAVKAAGVALVFSVRFPTYRCANEQSIGLFGLAIHDRFRNGFDSELVLLDGKHGLCGAWLLNQAARGMSFPLLSVNFAIKNGNSVSGVLTKDKMWHMDGSALLDGSCKLDADISTEVI